jgi:prepilin-type N-terminal cleavage/methylation domain-containing protein
MIRRLIKKITQDKAGATLVELLTALAIFSVVTLAATQIFKIVIEGQRSAIASDNAQSNMRYVLEIISKEIRMAQRSDNECDETFGAVSDNRVYNKTTNALGEALYFKNINGECTIYYLAEDENGIQRLKIQRGENSGYLTSDNIWVDNLKFLINDNTIFGVKSTQSSVTINFDLSVIGKEIHAATTTIQTTISARYYE